MGLKRKLEKFAKVMLCEDGNEKDLDNPLFISELKVDGTRCVVERDENGLRLYGRKGLSYTEILPDIAESFKKIRAFYRIEGELCYIDKEGHMIFSASQKRCQISNPKKVEQYRKAYPLVLFVFDIRQLNGENLESMPYYQRRLILKHFIELQKALYNLQNIRLIPTSTENRKFFEWAIAQGFEGVVLKKIDSPYIEGRSKFWLKCKRRDHTNFTLKDNAKL